MPEESLWDGMRWRWLEAGAPVTLTPTSICVANVPPDGSWAGSGRKGCVGTLGMGGETSSFRTETPTSSTCIADVAFEGFSADWRGEALAGESGKRGQTISSTFVPVTCIA